MQARSHSTSQFLKIVDVDMKLSPAKHFSGQCDRMGCKRPAKFAVRGYLWGVPLVCAVHAKDEPQCCSIEPLAKR